jgi:lon-related putative ATP-dependent protease
VLFLTTEQVSAELKVAPEDLYRRCDPAEIGAASTADVPPLDGTMGQERALSSLHFGLDIQAEGYNVFVAGPAGTGRNSTLRATVAHIAGAQPVPPDWCYVYNFSEHRQPSVMSLPAGRGRRLAQEMDAFIEACRREVPRVFDTDEYAGRREELTRDLQSQRERIFNDTEQQARARGFTLNVGPMGVATLPLKEGGQPMTRDEFAQLPQERKEEFQKRGEDLQSEISQAMIAVRRLEKEAARRLADLDKEVARLALAPLLNDLRLEYVDIPKAIEYLDHVETDLLDNLDALRGTEQEAGAPVLPLRPPIEEFLTRYKVNVFVSNENGSGAPVVIENNPTYYNLFGRVDYRSQFGAMTTDHTMIKAGAIHRANGGYLVVQAMDVLTNLFVWETLKRSIRARESHIENLGEQYSAIPFATLNPQAIPLDVKLVIVGSSLVYQVLRRADEDFRKLFRVKADFASTMDRTRDCVQLYTRFVRTRVDEEGLRHFDGSALARVVEHGSRLADHQQRLSTRFVDIADVVTESDYWAAKDGAQLVSAPHVDRAIEERIYRSNMIEEFVQKLIDDGTIMIDTSDAVAGQVNGIAVYDLADYRFGRPSKITASISLGRGQIVSIEREIQMSGKIHSKGFAILNGFLHGRYGHRRPLSLTASIGFEQMYDEIEGDSASCAELYALLSALAGLPAKQGIAVTGSVNQRGEVQPIGAVSEKVEGFYAVCKAKGLTGDQGVIIPRANIKHLMLRREVVDAVSEGRFCVWGVSRIDEGIELLTGTPAGESDARGRYPAGTVNRRVVDKLGEMSKRLASQGPRARRNDRKPAELPAPENNET